MNKDMLAIAKQDMVIPDFSVNDITMISINKLQSFKNHPFKVADNADMDTLVDSIEANGVLTPIHVRKIDGGKYEIISGHRRVRALKKLERKEVPAVIEELDDDEAIIAMVDSNIQREVLPSERAFSIKMKLEAIKHQGRTSRHNVEKLGTVSADIVGQTIGISGRQVNRYVKLTKLISPLLEKVDAKSIPVTLGFKIAELPEDLQGLALDYFESGCKLTDKIVDSLIENG